LALPGRARLQVENADLKKEVLLHGLPLPGGVADLPTGGVATGSGDHALSAIIGIVGNAWHRFVATVAIVRRDLMERS
jgi:hypothetical protein